MVRSIGREDGVFDVIVIGSGMGGGVLADALSDQGVKVLVLEAGGLRFPVHMNELPRSEDSDKWSEGIHGSVHHAGGTLRMSDDGSGVVDTNLKFDANDNLYCCDVSINPMIPTANPSLTLAALALRLADELRAKGQEMLEWTQFTGKNAWTGTESTGLRAL